MSMNDRFDFEALGKTWSLIFNNRAWRNVEQRTGKYGSLLMSQEEGLSFTEYTILTLCGLAHRHPDITMDKVDEIIDDLGYEALLEIVKSAVELSPPLRQRTSTKPKKMPSSQESTPTDTGVTQLDRPVPFSEDTI